jgi:hypothetical protein
LVALDPSQVADSESMIELHRQLNRFQAVVTRATGRFDADGWWALDGSRIAASWLMGHCRLPKPAAKAQVHLARTLRHLPACEEAWLTGDISVAHVRTLVAARRVATEVDLVRDEAMLVGYAKDLQFRDFSKAVDYWVQLADPEGADDEGQHQLDCRSLFVSQSYRDMWALDGQMDPVGGGIFAKQLFRIEEELFKADWAEAKAHLGRDPHHSELARTPRQRRADALVEMAIRSAAVPADARRPEPLITVLVDWPTFSGRICELANGTVVTPGAVVPWLRAAWVERIVFHSPSRKIDVGVARRLFTGATRRAVEVRDRECFHPSCDADGDHCQVDHIIPYSAGGPTTVDNGRLACGFHNRLRHKPPSSESGG